MQRIFLSYTYRPHPDYAIDTDLLQRTVRRVIEAMELRVEDGIDLGGRALDAEIDKRIRESDAMIAVFTPQADSTGAIDEPGFVITEFQAARTLAKPRIRILHAALVARGLGAGEEYIHYEPGKALDVVLKVMQTIALWKRELGRSVQVRIEPEDLGRRFVSANDRCEYELMVNYNSRAAVTTKLWHEPGGAFVYVPDLVEGAKLKVKMSVGGERWQSSFAVPQMGGITLQKE